jgi:tetratricopeptide (TPR) repeat protein
VEQAADFPHRPELRRELAGSHNNRGALLALVGRLKEAEAAYRDALALQKRLAADFPTRPEFRQHLAQTHQNLAGLLQATCRLKEAEAACRDALALQKHLAADFPTRPEFRQDLAGSTHNQGHLLYATGRLKEAEAAYRDAVALQKHLAADFPARPEFRQELARSYNNLGNLLHATGRPREAEAAHGEALALRKQLADEFPDDPKALNDIAWLLATCPARTVRNPAHAVESAQKAVGLAPQVREYWGTLGVARYRVGDWQAALDSLQKAVRLSHGGDGGAGFFLAMAHWQLGNKEQARRCYGQAVARVHGNKSRDVELNRFRAEAAVLLGLDGERGAAPPREE